MCFAFMPKTAAHILPIRARFRAFGCLEDNQTSYILVCRTGVPDVRGLTFRSGVAVTGLR